MNYYRRVVYFCYVNKLIIVTTGLFFGSFGLHAQLNIKAANDSSYTVANIVRYWVGKGVTVKNLTYSLNIPAFGSFSFTGTALGINEGIILSTGKAADATGPNNVQYTETRWNTAGDVDIFTMLGNTPNRDAAVIEFDFEPLTDTIQFRFVYGSEEYDYQVGQVTQSEDAFAAFLSGPNISGKINIATVAGLECNGCYVAVRNINNGQALFGTPPSGPPFNAEWYVYNPVGSPVTQFNAYTKAIPVKVAVSTCQTYHLKLVIADWGNIGWFDSGVFIEPGIFAAKDVGIYSTLPYSLLDNTINICESDAKPVLSVAGSHINWFIDNVLQTQQNDIAATVTGNYKAVVTTAGCVWQDSVQVNIGNDFGVEIPDIPRVCTQDTIEIKTRLKNTSDTTATHYQWQWSSIPMWTFKKNSPIQKIKPTQTTHVDLKVMNSGGCVKHSKSVITVNPIFYQTQLRTQTAADTHTCYLKTVTLQSGFQQIGIGSDAVAKEWRINGNLLSNNTNNVTLKAEKSGYYVFTARSASGCVITDSLYLKVDTIQLKHQESLSPCELSSVLVTVAGADSYVWREVGNPFFITTLSSWLYSPTRSQAKLTVTAQKQFSPHLTCSITDTIPLVAKPLPTYNKTNDTTVCSGSTLEISVLGAAPFWFNNQSVTGNTFSFTATRATTFVFNTVSNDNCTKTDSIRISVLPLPPVSISGKNTYCANDVFTFTASGANTYTWEYANSVAYGRIFSGLATIPYQSLSITGINTQTGCSRTLIDTLTIYENDLKDFITATGTAICPRDRQFPTLSVPEGYSYLWLPHRQIENKITANFAAEYIAELTDKNGCKAKDTLVVVQFCPSLTFPGIVPLPPMPEVFHIPNIITPNEDGVNDVFYISDLKPFTEVRIYNRWGVQIYESIDYKNTWEAKDVPDGVYFYQVVYENRFYNGWVQITR